jgi:sulfate permease, SulP family
MVSEAHDCPQISIFNLEGPLFFGTANIFEESTMNAVRPKLHYVILRMTKVPYVDMTGESKLARLVKDIKQTGGTVLISGIQQQPLEVFKKTELYSVIGEQHFFEHTGDAIDYAIARLDAETCRGCKHFAFRECAALSNSPNELNSLK